MRETDREQFSTIIAALAACFSREADHALFSAYWFGLRSLDISQVDEAVKRAMEEMRRMPVPAELLELAGKINTNSRGEIAFHAVTRTIASQGAYQSVEFDDPIANAAVRAVGGWARICQLSAEEWHKWTKKDFLRAYKALLEAGATEEQCKYLPGESERQNQSSGFSGHIPDPVRIEVGLPELRAGSVRPSLRVVQSVSKQLSGMTG